jgi:IS1 family transposase
VAKSEAFELDEIYWFLKRKAKTKTRENVYLVTMINPNPRQITAFNVCRHRTEEKIQRMVDNSPKAKKYCTDGFKGYLSIVFPGKHIRNCQDKSDTHNVESINADLRHFIPTLARRSRCFPRKIENLEAVIKLFCYAYNQFGLQKSNCRKPVKHKFTTNLNHVHKFQEVPFSIFDFL